MDKPEQADYPGYNDWLNQKPKHVTPLNLDKANSHLHLSDYPDGMVLIEVSYEGDYRWHVRGIVLDASEIRQIVTYLQAVLGEGSQESEAT